MIKNYYPGKFISVDGIDGSGKSTQVEFIKNWFLHHGYNVFFGREPSDSKIGSKLKKIIKKSKKVPEDPLKLQRMFIEDRKCHLQREIIPALKKENSVYVSDRYFLSTLAYGMAEGVSLDVLQKEHEEILKEDFILPDVMFVLDSDADIAIARLVAKKGEKKLEYFEKNYDILKKAAENFKILKDKFENIYFIESNSIPEVTDDIRKILNEKF